MAGIFHLTTSSLHESHGWVNLSKSNFLSSFYYRTLCISTSRHPPYRKVQGQFIFGALLLLLLMSKPACNGKREIINNFITTATFFSSLTWVCADGWKASLMITNLLLGLRHDYGREFWADLRELRKAAYAGWDDCPDSTFPELNQALGIWIFYFSGRQKTLAQFCALQSVEHIPPFPWCASNWHQLEMVTRHLPLHIASIFERYHLSSNVLPRTE